MNRKYSFLERIKLFFLNHKWGRDPQKIWNIAQTTSGKLLERGTLPESQLLYSIYEECPQATVRAFTSILAGRSLSFARQYQIAFKIIEDTCSFSEERNSEVTCYLMEKMKELEQNTIPQDTLKELEGFVGDLVEKF